MDLPFVADKVNAFVSGFLSIAATLVVFAACLAIALLIIVYIVDTTQTKQAIRRI